MFPSTSWFLISVSVFTSCLYLWSHLYLVPVHTSISLSVLTSRLFVLTSRCTSLSLIPFLSINPLTIHLQEHWFNGIFFRTIPTLLLGDTDLLVLNVKSATVFELFRPKRLTFALYRQSAWRRVQSQNHTGIPVTRLSEGLAVCPRRRSSLQYLNKSLMFILWTSLWFLHNFAPRKSLQSDVAFPDLGP